MSTVKAGGAKGTAIVETIKADTEKKMTRKAIAESVGCTVGRVGESVRWLAGNGTDEEKELVAHLVAKREAKGAEGKAEQTEQPAESKTDSTQEQAADDAEFEAAAPKPKAPARNSRRNRKASAKA